MKSRVNLKDWKIINEFGYYGLIGIAVNHPRLGTTSVRTSKLLKIDFEKMKAETLNTIYLLEE